MCGREGVAFYYLLIASRARCVADRRFRLYAFYYLLIASVVRSSRTLLYGFPRRAPSLSLGGEHSLSVSV